MAIHVMKMCKEYLFLDTLSDLSLETTLDGTNRTPRSARHARHEEDTVLLCQEGIKRFTCLAGDIFNYQGRRSEEVERGEMRYEIIPM